MAEPNMPQRGGPPHLKNLHQLLDLADEPRHHASTDCFRGGRLADAIISKKSRPKNKSSHAVKAIFFMRGIRPPRAPSPASSARRAC